MTLTQQFNRATEKARKIFNDADHFLHGYLTVFKDAGKSFTRERAPEAAAGIAYYALFSLFPLLIVAVVVISYILKDPSVQSKLMELLSEALPISPDFVVSNITDVLAKRGTFSVVALVSLAWSASGVFNTLTLHVDRAWGNHKIHNFIERRLVALAILGGLSLLLLFILVVRTSYTVLPEISIPLLDQFPFFKTTFWNLINLIAPRVFKLMIFWIIYTLVPKSHVPMKASFYASIFVLILSEVISILFSEYVGSGYVQYELVYGSFGRIIALLFWIYLNSYLILFGAHLSAAIANRKCIKNPVVQDLG